jgi:hypothetical protein
MRCRFSFLSFDGMVAGGVSRLGVDVNRPPFRGAVP